MLTILKKYFLFPFISLWVIVFSAFTSFAQTKKEAKILIGEKGLYPISNYTTKMYGAAPQNWAVVQDKRGVIYFGNNEGILEYDGVNWKTIRVPNETNIRALAIDAKGKIYVGAAGEMGYLEPDATGTMRFVSLVPQIDKNDREFMDVWSIQVTAQGIFFQSYNKIFRWDGKKMKVWNAEKAFHRIFKVYDRIFVYQREVGLMEIIGDKLIALKGGEVFADDGIFAMVPFTGKETENAQKKILIGTQKKGLFIMKMNPHKNTVHDEGTVSTEKITTQVDPFLIENRSYNALKSNEEYSLATLIKGSVQIDADGNLISFMNKDEGLQDETIYSQFIDTSGYLWLALSNGIAKVQINSPVTFFSDKNGIGGNITSVTRHNGTLYLTTTQGVFSLRQGNVVNGIDLNPAAFEKNSSINEECWDLLSFHSGSYSTLLAASDTKIFSLDKQNNVSTLFPYGPWIFHRSVFDSSRVFLGLDNGFASIYWDGSKWIDEGSILEIKESVHSITEDAEGNVWLGHPNGVIKINFKNKQHTPIKNKDSGSYSYTKYNTTNHDFVDGIGDIKVINIEGKIIFITAKGIYKQEGGKFIPDNTYGAQFADNSREIYRTDYDSHSKTLWLAMNIIEKKKLEFGYIAKEKDGKYSWNTTPFLPYADQSINCIVQDENGITWFGGAAGLFRYDSHINEKKASTNCIIRRVTIGKDSILFNGTFYDSLKVSSLKQNSSLKYSLPFANNSVMVEFAALDFANESIEQYKYYLDGFDKDWSNWKHETKAVYTNLSEGNYTFHVKAKNIYNEESKEAVYEFTVLPPWYRTWWAYILYLLASIAFIWGIVTYFSRGLKAIIKERTAEVVKQKEEIEAKNRNITDSINYAKRIQEAILPPYELMRSRFPESFILYKPKDIVAGDFYWFSEKDGKFIIAACDCTGHGVPGAFMSLIGYSLINEVVLEKSLTVPSQVLDTMKKGIIKSLGQTGQEGEQKDGMDMSLVSLEIQLNGKKVNQKLSYAGANNPLYIVRKGELIELNADKMPIGIYLGIDRPFENKEMLLEPGDTVYLFSDGYADQFGGDKGKKFTKKRFKEVLLSMQNENMKAQKNVLDKTLRDWSRAEQQVDDVLVIGIRIS